MPGLVTLFASLSHDLILWNNPPAIIVAGEKMGLANFKSGFLNPPSELSTNIKGMAEYVYQNTKENTSFSYVVSCGAVYQATGYLSSGKKYGVITITCYIKERNATFFITNGVVNQNTIGA